MGALPLDVATTREHLQSTAARVVSLAATRDVTRPVPGLDWTVGELLIHLVTVVDGLALIAAGDLTPEDYWAKYAPDARGQAHDDRAALNQGLIAGFDTGQLAEAPQLIASAADNFLSHTATQPPDALFRYVDGDRDVATVTGVLLSELLVHGWDLARALGQDWPISPEAARLALTALVSLVPDHFHYDRARGMRVAGDMRVRGGPRFGIALHDETLEILPTPPDRPDFHLSAEPVTYLLVSYGRKNQWVAAARGQLVTWGRRPWLAPRLATLIDKP